MRIISILLMLFIAGTVFTNAQNVICIVDYSLDSCQVTSQYTATCSSIKECTEYTIKITSANEGIVSSIIYIPDDSQMPKGNNDCDTLYFLPSSENIIFYAANTATIDCQGNPFLAVRTQKPITVEFYNVGFVNSPSNNHLGTIDLLNPVTNPNTPNPILRLINTVNSGSSNSGSGGFIATNGYDVQLINVTVSKCYSADQGGVAYLINGTLLVANSTFIENTAYSIGGAFSVENMNIVGSTFISNNCTSYGGALYSQMTGEIDNCTFTKNFVNGDGGAINVAFLTVSNSIFTQNLAGGNGGAINCLNGTISSSTFIGNSGYNGGALYSYYSLGIFVSKLFHNSAQLTGGAGVANGVLSIGGSEFINNTAQIGGALYVFNGVDVNSILNSYFSQNSAYSGGAIYGTNTPNYDFSQSTFENNKATYQAGAVYFGFTPTLLNGGIFIGNTNNGIGSNTFNDDVMDENIVYVDNDILYNSIIYFVPLVSDKSVPNPNYAKAYNVNGSCVNGLAEIRVDGLVVRCQCFTGYTGKTCDKPTGKHNILI